MESLSSGHRLVPKRNRDSSSNSESSTTSQSAASRTTASENISDALIENLKALNLGTYTRNDYTGSNPQKSFLVNQGDVSGNNGESSGSSRSNPRKRVRKTPRQPSRLTTSLTSKFFPAKQNQAENQSRGEASRDEPLVRQVLQPSRGIVRKRDRLQSFLDILKPEKARKRQKTSSNSSQSTDDEQQDGEWYGGDFADDDHGVTFTNTVEGTFLNKANPNSEGPMNSIFIPGFTLTPIVWSPEVARSLGEDVTQQNLPQQSGYVSEVSDSDSEDLSAARIGNPENRGIGVSDNVSRRVLAVSEEESESEGDYYDAYSNVVQDDLAIEEYKAVGLPKHHTVILSKEVWGLILGELYKVERQSGSTFNIPSSFRTYRLVSQVFDYNITALAYRHLELHNRQQPWDTNAIWADMRVNEVIMGEDMYTKFRHVQEVTIQETPTGAVGKTYEIILGCKSLKNINWVWIWRPMRGLRAATVPFPAGLKTILTNKPNLGLHMRNFSLPILDKDVPEILDSIPAQNLISLELATSGWEVTTPVHNFLKSATKLKSLRLIPHGRTRNESYFNASGGKLPLVKNLHLESYDWPSHLWHNDVTAVWTFGEVEHLTMDDVDLSTFLRVVEDIQFSKLRTLKIRDPVGNPDTVALILSGLYTLVSRAPHLKELDIWYRAKIPFYDIDEVGAASPFEPLTRLHVLRGVDGPANIIDAILEAGFLADI